MSTLVLHELGGAYGARYSAFSWRTRMALKHKGLAFDTVAVRVSDKAAIAFSGQGKVPILTDGATVVSDSWKIAEHLDAAYPERPALFGGPHGKALSRLINATVDRQWMAALAPAMAMSVTQIVDAGDAAHIRAGFEKGFGRPLEDLYAAREATLKGFRRILDPLRATLRSQPFVCGAAPAYADIIMMSPLQWARIVHPDPVLEADDAVNVWFERMLDLHDGYARAEPTRAGHG